MKNTNEEKLNQVINELSHFLEKDYSSNFKYLTAKEDRQLFFLAGVLTKLKHVLEDEGYVLEPEIKNVIAFPLHRRLQDTN